MIFVTHLYRNPKPMSIVSDEPSSNIEIIDFNNTFKHDDKIFCSIEVFLLCIYSALPLASLVLSVGKRESRVVTNAFRSI